MSKLVNTTGTGGTYTATLAAVNDRPKMQTGGKLDIEVTLDEDGRLSLVPRDAVAAFILRRYAGRVQVSKTFISQGPHVPFKQNPCVAFSMVREHDHGVLSDGEEGDGITINREQYERCKALLFPPVAQKPKKRRRK